MSKKIMVLTGSPRKDGNSAALAEAIINGAKGKGHSIVRFNVSDKKTLGCIACNSCYSKDKACPFDDSFSEFANLLEGVDALVISTPMYWFSFPAQLKSIIDKFYAFEVAEKKLTITESMLLTCGELSSEDVFSGMIESHKQFCAHQNWNNRGSFVVTEVAEKGDINKTDALDKAFNIGASF